MKIITLYANQNEVNYYSCIVKNSTYNQLDKLSTIGGFKRFSIDYEDDTDKPVTNTNEIYDYFLSKVFPKVSKEDITKEIGLKFIS